MLDRRPLIVIKYEKGKIIVGVHRISKVIGILFRNCRTSWILSGEAVPDITSIDGPIDHDIRV